MKNKISQYNFRRPLIVALVFGIGGGIPLCVLDYLNFNGYIIRMFSPVVIAYGIILISGLIVLNRKNKINAFLNSFVFSLVTFILSSAIVFTFMKLFNYKISHEKSLNAHFIIFGNITICAIGTSLFLSLVFKTMSPRLKNNL